MIGICRRFWWEIVSDLKTLYLDSLQFTIFGVMTIIVFVLISIQSAFETELSNTGAGKTDTRTFLKCQWFTRHHDDVLSFIGLGHAVMSTLCVLVK